MQKFKQYRKGKNHAYSQHTKKTAVKLLAYIFLDTFFVCVYKDIKFYGWLLAIYVGIYFMKKYTYIL